MSENLTPKQEAFCQRYIETGNASEAYRLSYDAGKMKPETINRTAKALLDNRKIAARLDKLQAGLLKRHEVTVDKVLEHWWAVATSEPNDLIQYRRVCCRHCHGTDHTYQWKDAEEYRRALATAAAVEGADPALFPTDEGGYGFNPTQDPHPACPQCHGEGHGEVHVADTRKLSGGARLLYDGVKVTDRGLEVKMLDRAKALENVARHLGMFIDKREITGKDGAPLIPVTKEQRDAAVAAALDADS